MESRDSWGSWDRQSPFVSRGGSGGRLFGWLAALLGMPLVLWAAILGREALELREWPASEGVIVQSVVLREQIGFSSSRRRSEPVFAPRLHLRYDYVVDDSRYQGTRIDQLSVARRDARADAARFPMDKRVTVRYDRDRPSEAVLEVAIPWSALAGGVVGLVLLLIASRLLRRRSKLRPRISRALAGSSTLPSHP